MNVTLDYLTGNRKWFVRDFVVWGDTGTFDAAIIATEVLGETNVVFLRELVGGSAQVIEYTDLTDHRGNQLPETISNPTVIIVPKNQAAAHVVGIPGTDSFQIAKSSTSAVNPVVDLIIMEMN